MVWSPTAEMTTEVRHGIVYYRSDNVRNPIAILQFSTSWAGPHHRWPRTLVKSDLNELARSWCSRLKKVFTARVNRLCSDLDTGKTSEHAKCTAVSSGDSSFRHRSSMECSRWRSVRHKTRDETEDGLNSNG
ncbi:hypothetical protein RRG08_018768 [Elysia crispata]|uniref:Uncharacterized protein n=1 Tax=Elysia crispata TaxID=231223 RepID=A0AAE0ZY92_9GAST|nr:hypothetical protein RRG08_018768 [Elysia crispata]